MSEEPLIAIFVDYENLAIGARDSKWRKLNIDLILKRLLEKGRIVYKRAYCDWSQYRNDVRDFHARGIELIDIPRSKMSGKNSADIRMVVDALDLCYSKDHIEIFALLTGDSDFSPLVSKLKENHKRVIGCGVKNSTSGLLVNSCDEFLYYDDLAKAADVKAEKQSKKKPADKKKAEKPREDGRADEGYEQVGEETDAIDLMLEIVESLSKDYEAVWGSMIKQAMRRVHPDFNEASAGYRNFTELLQEAEREGCIKLEYDERRGNYRVELLDEA
ncbi:MAG: NYN domain-containing protein [Spirochaetaceae bacterium]|nr:NYN domain-containing protein [Myxococcales bacterium]MCB9724745.1 NYN domain-containing protein [Spirochaetaceae bacterium]